MFCHIGHLTHLPIEFLFVVKICNNKDLNSNVTCLHLSSCVHYLQVEVLVGKDKGKQGLVVQIFQEINSVIVEGLNTYLRDMGKETGNTTQKFIIRQEAPLLVTNEVALVDPSDM